MCIYCAVRLYCVFLFFLFSPLLLSECICTVVIQVATEYCTIKQNTGSGMHTEILKISFYFVFSCLF